MQSLWGETAMARLICLVFGGIAYLIFFATFLYLVAFVGDLPWVPHTIDRRAGEAALGPAVATDVILIALFGLQHSVMARAGFKAGWTRIVPEPIERSTYVLFTTVALNLMFILWQPLPGVVWDAGNGATAVILWALFALGWLIVLTSTFLINHFELFGLKEVWAHARGAAAQSPEFRQPLFYRFVRHPIYSGFTLAFWATPQMTRGHLLFALGMTLYILIAIQFEERDLTRMFGKAYEDYRTRVGMLAPRFRSGKP